MFRSGMAARGGAVSGIQDPAAREEVVYGKKGLRLACTGYVSCLVRPWGAGARRVPATF